MPQDDNSTEPPVPEYEPEPDQSDPDLSDPFLERLPDDTFNLISHEQSPLPAHIPPDSTSTFHDDPPPSAPSQYPASHPSPEPILTHPGRLTYTIPPDIITRLERLENWIKSNRLG